MTVKKLLILLKPYIPVLLLSMLLAVLSVVCTLNVPVVIGHAVDSIVSSGNVSFEKIPSYMVQIIFFAVCGGMLQWMSALISGKCSARATRDMRKQLFASVCDASLEFIDGTSNGKIINCATNDIEQVCDGLNSTLTQLFTGISTIIGTLAFMFAVDYIVALVVVVLTPLSLAVATVIARGSHKYFMQTTSVQGELHATAEELLANYETVSNYRFNSEAISRFEKVNGRLKKCGFRSQLYSAMVNPSTRFVNAMVYAAAGVVGAVSAVNGRMSVGEVSTFLIYASQYTKPFNEISAVVANLQSALACAGRVFELSNCPREYQPEAEEVLTNNADGAVRFDSVSFSYTPKKPLILDMKLDIPPATRVAIVGKTGCGKTTLINLLMRFYNPSGGKIEIDGQNISTLKSSEHRGRFGMVLQDTQLFSGTIKYNLTYGNPDATDEEIDNACRLACCRSFIKRLPDGFNTVIGKDTQLSEGQRQLICVARALLCKPEIALLDEATSGIDIRTEQKLHRAFAKLMEGRTSFVVAHRLETIKGCDLILVMDSGKIVEKGNHSELLELNGLYAKMYNGQSA